MSCHVVFVYIFELFVSVLVCVSMFMMWMSFQLEKQRTVSTLGEQIRPLTAGAAYIRVFIFLAH